MNIQKSKRMEKISGHRLADFVAAMYINEEVGKEIFDISDNNLAANLIGTAHFENGKYGCALALDGNSDYAAFGNGLYDGTLDLLTIVANVKMNTIAAGIKHIIINRSGNTGANPDSSYTLRISEDDIAFGVSHTSILGQVNEVISADTYYNIAAVVNGNNPVKIYLDANEQTLDVSNNYNNTNPQYSFNTPVKKGTIGVREQSTGTKDRYFNGIIDFVIVYNRALSTPEIVWIYENPLRMLKHIRKKQAKYQSHIAA